MHYCYTLYHGIIIGHFTTYIHRTIIYYIKTVLYASLYHTLSHHPLLYNTLHHCTLLYDVLHYYTLLFQNLHHFKLLSDAEHYRHYY
ncbi:hypothetical protein GDO78_003237 [Eleutherodactylus coqui]|uniref:Uncharacterized protein n=1 Tax=Eleutherodactylus coqui TaxID=57060 RepID=A0A8J6EWY9_ELECQ|nr:hypothetical protein GDO78_003237 [Eleutherodactylus coqui]